MSLRDDRMLPDPGAIVDLALTDNAPRDITLSSRPRRPDPVIEPYLQPSATDLFTASRRCFARNSAKILMGRVSDQPITSGGP